MKRVAILQSSYLPWKGYFDIISSVDEFVIYDCAQFTSNDWRNRNRLKTRQGPTWITVPVRHGSLDQAIDEVEVADRRCFKKHWNTLRQSYARAECIEFCDRFVQPLLLEAAECRTISEVNVLLIEGVCGLLGIGTKITNARELSLEEGRNERLVSICSQLGANEYLSGPAARAYLDEDTFGERGIAVRWMDYPNYREYTQPHPPFEHRVSILDLIACTGGDALSYITGANAQEMS